MKLSRITVLLFILSPILSIPLVFQNIYQNKNSAFILIILLAFFASYLYLPSLSGDKAYYFELHRLFSSLSFNEFLFFIKVHSTDFIFYLIIYFFAIFGFSFSFTSGIITSITVGMIIFLFKNITKNSNLNKSISFIFFMMIIFSFSLPNLFSGMRFYLASAFILIGLHQSIIYKNILKGFIFLILGTLTHFSTIIYLFLVIFYLLSKNNLKFLKIIFLFSFFFLLIPKEYLIEMFSFFNLDAVYIDKINAYVIEQKTDTITNNGHYIFLLTNTLWYYLASIYILLNIKKKNNPYLVLMLFSLILENITFSFPTIFNRYAIISILIFIISLMYSYKTYKIIRIIFFLLLMSTTFLDILVQRDNFQNSYMKYEILTLPTLLLIDPINGKKISKER